MHNKVGRGIRVVTGIVSVLAAAVWLAPSSFAGVGGVASITTSATAAATVGGSIQDSAVVSTGFASPPAGTVTFNLYGPNDPNCTQALAFTSPNRMLAGIGPGMSQATSAPFTPTAAGT